MNNFQALVLEKVNDQANLNIKSLNIDGLPQGEVTIKVAYSRVNYKDSLVAIRNQMVKSYPVKNKCLQKRGLFDII